MGTMGITVISEIVVTVETVVTMVITRTTVTMEIPTAQEKT